MLIPPAGPLQRCPECGGMVQMPCLVCYFANCETYPDSILEAWLDPSSTDESRRCIRCQRTLPICAFGEQQTKAGSILMEYSTCRRCRTYLEKVKHA